MAKWCAALQSTGVTASLASIILAAVVAMRPAAAVSTPDDASACLGFIQEAERSQSIPEGLLMAIGYTESGRVIPDGRRVPWPWTVNALGQGHVFETKEGAIAFVEELQAEGIGVIDVGCMQVNLYYHPDAFGSLDAAFDPATNVAYAARFLKELQSDSGDWSIATRYYHSRTPYLGRFYAGRVIANGFGGIVSDIEPTPPLSAEEKAMLSEAVPDHLTAANEVIAMSPVKFKTRTTAVEQPTANVPVSSVISGAPSLGGSATQIGESLD